MIDQLGLRFNGRLRATLLLLLVLTIGCARSGEPGRVIVLGLDGFDPDTVDLLISEGKLPNLSMMRKEGAYGRLRSTQPMLSPILWTTIATGKAAHDHGIGHFVTLNPLTNTEVPATSQMRRVKAVWNIVSDAGRTVDVIGWWATWPAETVQGGIVSDHTAYHFLFENGFTDPNTRDIAGVVHPPELWGDINQLIRFPSHVSFDELSRFASINREELNNAFSFDNDVSQLRWMISSASSYTAIGRELWKKHNPDLLMVYVEATDSASHLFGHLFRADTLAGQLAEQQQRFGGTVEKMYAYADEIVGKYIELLDASTTLVVLSDHGFQLGALPADPTRLEDLRRVSADSHRDESILYMYGYGVRSNAEIRDPELFDIVPTLLALLHVPAASDMPGRELTEALAHSSVLQRIATYESRDSHARSNPPKTSTIDPAIIEHLRSLGYLDASAPQSERNLAAIQFEAGRYQEAADAFRELVRRTPTDAGARVGLAASLGAMGNFSEALRVLDEAEGLAPASPDIWHNRGVIFERQGRREEAIAAYRRALSITPNYAPSNDELVRLTGESATHLPHTKEERDAYALAQSAQRAARRGDYPRAWAQIEMAIRLAPDYALLHQYRANIAYFRGDHSAARSALERALEIEPDNEFFRSNLEKLQGNNERSPTGAQREKKNPE